MGKKKRMLIDIVQVSFSNVIKLFSGVLVGFILPKIVGLTDYGYYKTFTLYATYVGMFHFGMSDGLYLKYGGMSLESLDRDRLRFFSGVFLAMEGLLALLLLAVSALAMRGEYRFIFCCLALYLLVHNGTGYYQSLSQATSRFKELAARNSIQSLLTTAAIAALWGVHLATRRMVSYRVYTALYVAIAALLAVWYVWTYRAYTFGRRESYWSELPQLFRLGFPLMVANLCSSLILTLDRQFVNVLFDKDTYAIYAFAYNLLSLVTVATSAISTVLYPNIKKMSADSLRDNYVPYVTAILVMMFGCIFLYYPLSVFIGWFLPNYKGSLEIFRIIFPGLAVSSVITIIMHNYYKARHMSFAFFVKSAIILALSAAMNYAAYRCFHTTRSISAASIATMLVWYVLAERTITAGLGVSGRKNFIYMVLMMAAFYLATTPENLLISFLMYLALFAAVTWAFYRKTLRAVLRRHGA